LRTAANFIILLSILALLGSGGCGKSVSESSIDSTGVVKDPIPEPVDLDLDKIIERDTLIAIIDNSSTSFFIYKGQPMGFEYELLKLLSKELGVNLRLIQTTSIEGAFRMLNKGEGDIIAYNLTVTTERKKIVKFTKSQYTTRQVLVQRKPENWRSMKLHEIDAQLIRNQVDLIGKEVYVRNSSSYLHRLEHLSEEIGGEILIIEESEDADTEALIRRVASGDIDYTIADEDVALINTAYYPNLDVETPVSFPQRIAWAIRKNANELESRIDNWLTELQREPTYNVIYKKYFENPRVALLRARSDYSSIQGGHISEYDDLIKQWADSIGWDWKLLASQIYQESKFDPQAVSWAGAKGLMQLVDGTASEYGVRNPFNPAQSIRAGVRYLMFIDRFWSRYISDPEEKIKFVLASYNVGLGHVIDAQRLARKYGDKVDTWDNNVAYYLLHKSNPKYYKDEVVESGYCKGEEPVTYVNEILTRYTIYQQLVSS